MLRALIVQLLLVKAIGTQGLLGATAAGAAAAAAAATAAARPCFHSFCLSAGRLSSLPVRGGPESLPPHLWGPQTSQKLRLYSRCAMPGPPKAGGPRQLMKMSKKRQATISDFFAASKKPFGALQDTEGGPPPLKKGAPHCPLSSTNGFSEEIVVDSSDGEQGNPTSNRACSISVITESKQEQQQQEKMQQRELKQKEVQQQQLQNEKERHKQNQQQEVQQQHQQTQQLQQQPQLQGEQTPRETQAKQQATQDQAQQQQHEKQQQHEQQQHDQQLQQQQHDQQQHEQQQHEQQQHEQQRHEQQQHEQLQHEEQHHEEQQHEEQQHKQQKHEEQQREQQKHEELQACGSALFAAAASLGSSTLLSPRGEPLPLPAAEAAWREALGDGWFGALRPELSKGYFQSCLKRVAAERRQFPSNVYPPEQAVFYAFRATPLEKVKVVIVGQDPYHQPGQAMGLCFSVSRGVRPPPSLQNIFKEIESNFPGSRNSLFPLPHGDLTSWATQGVLLLNALLSVRRDSPMSHKDFGWQLFTDRVLSVINEKLKGVVFLLWGKPAQKKASSISRQKHHVLEAGHPSPLAVRFFTGCGHFKKCNELLTAMGKTPIDFTLKP